MGKKLRLFYSVGVKIYVQRLRDGQPDPLEEDIPPEVMEIEERELRFEDPIEVRGQCYLADDHLVVEMDLSSRAQMPCAICNEDVAIPLNVEGVRSLIDLDEIKTGVFDASELIREELLLVLPLRIECNDRCPEREKLAK